MHLPVKPEAALLDMHPGDILLLLSDGIYEYRSASDEEYGQARVQASRAATPRQIPVAELAAVTLLDSVKRFAEGAPQQDDITLVLVKRKAETVSARAFSRSFDAISGVFAFSHEVFEREHIDPELLNSVDLTLEELFTNMVKYSVSSSQAQILIGIAPIEDGVEVTLTDYDVEAFDVTHAPDVDIHLPIEQRKPGGLGLHLIRRLVDRVEYEYAEERRESRIRFRKTRHGRAAPGGDVVESDDARD